MFAAADLSDDAFLGGRLRLWQPRVGYRAAVDPVLLAAAVAAKPGQSVLELGCGAGAAILCLATRMPGLTLAGIELQPPYADLARRNAARNGVALAVETGDLAQMPAVLRRGFDHVIANPPFYPADGSPSPDVGRDLALRSGLPLATWLDASARRLSPGGYLTLILASAALPEALRAIDTRLGSVAVLPVAPRQGQQAHRIILRARKGGRAVFRLLAPFVLHDGVTHERDRDSHTAAANAVLRDGCDLCARFS